mmetsp:Transcript_36298/g.43860  ORF Transcript_36298/g.43860 Transcript_36298/m.43860 type:complete len:212 (-) Transcript_36298:135-770(-)|eukprot:CAMPEP_0197845210 /NCGR_PEP_ID=MMETSP1438-20131217/2164_1 /TAXON_ID=1461541 /ORGANISM="Pterosperma sp., Strain CCMP1384" /LENGTH=211 /DNA_ID=CAMNT_0043456397 /DNA_START=276 /DNA_END=911 /DNA_ORIENTATION=+
MARWFVISLLSVFLSGIPLAQCQSQSTSPSEAHDPWPGRATAAYEIDLEAARVLRGRRGRSEQVPIKATLSESEAAAAAAVTLQAGTNAWLASVPEVNLHRTKAKVERSSEVQSSALTVETRPRKVGEDAEQSSPVSRRSLYKLERSRFGRGFANNAVGTGSAAKQFAKLPNKPALRDHSRRTDKNTVTVCNPNVCKFNNGANHNTGYING